ncbi:MAG: putative porin [Bacteroidota bacterium]
MKTSLRLYVLLYISVTPFIYGGNGCLLSDSLNSNIHIFSDTTITDLEDSISAIDTTIEVLSKKTLIPIQQISILNNYKYSTKSNQNTFSKEDYRTSADIFTYMPYGFLQDLGQLGQPNEQMFYGLGFGNINYNRDGVGLNNPWQNSYDLNKLPFERIDSLEILPLPRGFLFNTYNNPVSINFYSRDIHFTRPITRLKFYQASYDEGFVDLLFHTYVTQRIDFGVGLTVSGIDSRFYNSDYESWKLNGKIGYMFSDNLFIRANYYFMNDSLAINGGLPSSIIDNEIYPDVLYPNRYQLTTNHFADVKILAKLFPNSKTDITFYYQYDNQTFRQNPDSIDDGIPIIVDDNNYQTIGASILNDYSIEYLNLLISANYETTKYSLDIISTDESENMLAIAGQLQLTPIGSMFVPTAYAKYSNYNNNNYLGFGVDLNVSLNNYFILFGGLSFYSKPHTIMERFYSDPKNLPPEYLLKENTDKSEIKTLEIAAKLNLDLIDGSLSYFRYSNSNAFKPIINNYVDTLLINEISILESYSQEISGFNINLNLNLWKFLFSNNITYYFTSNNENYIAHPNYSIAGKLYYIDQLFDNNLKLRTGINYRITGEQPYFIYDYEKSMQARFVTSSADGIHLLNNEFVPQSFQFDLFFAGTIQDAATIFVILENVIDNEYYIIPHYYKQPQMLRLGVSWLLYD